jgi:peptidyl-prolyl cis-trans isomerase A (cyclophilin A)
MSRSVLTILLLALLTPFSAASDDPPETGVPPEEQFPEGRYATIDTTMGRIVVRLLPDQAPQAVAQFVALAEGTLERADPMTGEKLAGRYYDGVGIYLAEAGIRFEAGDSTNTGRGGPPLWVSPTEGAGPVNYSSPGRLGLVPAPGRGASPYSIMITASAQPRLSGRYPCLGEVVSGADVVMRISEVKTHRNGKPIEPLRIDKIRTFTVGEPSALPEIISYQAERRRLAPLPRSDKD